MIELFEQNIRTNRRQSSKGNQLKWENKGIWYKADYTGYEGLTEYMISHLLKRSTLSEQEFVCYDLEEIKYGTVIYNGAKSKNFLSEDWQIITLERLFHNFFGESLYKSLYRIPDHEERLRFLVQQVERMTGLQNFGVYMNKLLTIDAFFLNEDRHMHNIARASSPASSTRRIITPCGPPPVTTAAAARSTRSSSPSTPSPFSPPIIRQNTRPRSAPSR